MESLGLWNLGLGRMGPIALEVLVLDAPGWSRITPDRELGVFYQTWAFPAFFSLPGLMGQ